MGINMKKIILSMFAALVFASCSTFFPKIEELQQAPQCTVWKDGLIGNKEVVVVEDELAKVKVTCWIAGMLACTYTDYTFNGKTNEIRSSLPPEDKTIGTLVGNKMNVDMTGAKVETFELKNGHAEYWMQGPIGPKQKKSAEYNSRCTTRQAALGIISMIAK